MPGREVFPLANVCYRIQSKYRSLYLELSDINEEAIVLRPFDENAPTQQWLFVPSKGSDSGPYRILNAATENTSSRRFLGFITRNWDPIFFPPRLIEPDRADVCGLVDSDMPQTWKLDSTEQDPSRTDCVTGQSSSSFTCASIKCISPYDMYPILLGTVFNRLKFLTADSLDEYVSSLDYIGGKWNVFMASRDPEISPDGWYYLRNVGTSRYLSVSVAQFKLREPRFNLDPDGAAAAFQVKYAGGSTEVRLALLPSSYLTEVGGNLFNASNASNSSLDTLWILERAIDLQPGKRYYICLADDPSRVISGDIVQNSYYPVVEKQNGYANHQWDFSDIAPGKN
ncbi:hypothetical protein D9757_007921 [Collybiopsis confluens]|uniref:Uncharacterized protein n=1 Tax=Collybiopsis confluens TaxID=2823264 RepID=A0A8H5CEY6_9AGAR|nr:hypothetical protein D9757_014868 [Collybiopsis confluens]KAF5380331.1 hypothetical protein D9757_007921 [Collybiopsis confluens]